MRAFERHGNHRGNFDCRGKLATEVSKLREFQTVFLPAAQIRLHRLLRSSRVGAKRQRGRGGTAFSLLAQARLQKRHRAFAALKRGYGQRQRLSPKTSRGRTLRSGLHCLCCVQQGRVDDQSVFLIIACRRRWRWNRALPRCGGVGCTSRRDRCGRANRS